jgi:hypothetical protein
MKRHDRRLPCNRIEQRTRENNVRAHKEQVKWTESNDMDRGPIGKAAADFVTNEIWREIVF